VANQESPQEEIKKLAYSDSFTKIERFVKGNLTILKLVGRYTSRVKEKVLQLLGDAPIDLALEVQNIEPIDLSFASFLRRTQEVVNSRGGSLTIIKPPSRLVEMLNMCYGERAFKIVEDESQLAPVPPDRRKTPLSMQEYQSGEKEHTAQIAQFRKEVLKTEAREKSLDIARKRLRRFLPQSPPHIPGLDTAFEYRPSDKVGGDFFNFVELGQNRHGVIIGDISGHGIEAAVLTGIAKKAIDIWARTLIAPDKVLMQANRDIYPDLDESTFITLCYGVIDASAMSFTFARAGHPFPIAFNPVTGKKPFPISSKGMSIGMDMGNLFDRILEVKTFSLHSGDRLLLYTDGLTEAIDPTGSEAGFQRLLNILEENPGKTAEQTIANIFAVVDELSKKDEQQDDITAICINCTAP
jgi:serine phosphatase RsbU (regulator of sigma subunit)